MKNWFCLLISGLCIACGTSSEVEIPATLKMSKGKLLVILSNNLPSGIDHFNFYENDKVKKQIGNLYDLSKGDTISINWNFKSRTNYSLMGFGISGDTKFYSLKHTFFMIDTKADTLIYDVPYKPDTSHRKVSY